MLCTQRCGLAGDSLCDWSQRHIRRLREESTIGVAKIATTFSQRDHKHFEKRYGGNECEALASSDGDEEWP
jgi:hypothetical protein